eukprot:g5786.t1
MSTKVRRKKKKSRESKHKPSTPPPVHYSPRLQGAERTSLSPRNQRESKLESKLRQRDSLGYSNFDQSGKELKRHQPREPKTPPGSGTGRRFLNKNSSSNNRDTLAFEDLDGNDELLDDLEELPFTSSEVNQSGSLPSPKVRQAAVRAQRRRNVGISPKARDRSRSPSSTAPLTNTLSLLQKHEGKTSARIAFSSNLDEDKPSKTTDSDDENDDVLGYLAELSDVSSEDLNNESQDVFVTRQATREKIRQKRAESEKRQMNGDYDLEIKSPKGGDKNAQINAPLSLEELPSSFVDDKSPRKNRNRKRSKVRSNLKNSVISPVTSPTKASGYKKDSRKNQNRSHKSRKSGKKSRYSGWSSSNDDSGGEVYQSSVQRLDEDSRYRRKKRKDTYDDSSRRKAGRNHRYYDNDKNSRGRSGSFFSDESDHTEDDLQERRENRDRRRDEAATFTKTRRGRKSKHRRNENRYQSSNSRNRQRSPDAAVDDGTEEEEERESWAYGRKNKSAEKYDYDDDDDWSDDGYIYGGQLGLKRLGKRGEVDLNSLHTEGPFRQSIEDRLDSSLTRSLNARRESSNSTSPKNNTSTSPKENNDPVTHSSHASLARISKASAAEDNINHAKMIKWSNVRAFLLAPTPVNMGVVTTFIKREKSHGSTKYFCYLEAGKNFLMAAKRRKLQKKASYLISCNKNDLSRNGTGFIGKVRSKVFGTDYTVCDSGIAPREVKNEKDKKKVRKELLSASYTKNTRFQFTPREVRVSIPTIDQKSGDPFIIQPTLETQGILARAKARDKRLMFLGNKQPRYNHETKTYILDFGSRVTMASVKNFQLVAPGNEDNIIVQFGRAGHDKFTLDFRWPFSPIQAFGLALSCFEA